MKNETNHSDPLITQLKQWLENLTADEQNTVRTLWEKADDADEAADITVTEEEKKRSLAHIKSELGLTAGDDADTRPDTTGREPELPAASNTASKWPWMAAAAAVLIAAGIGIAYLLIPATYTAPYGTRQTVRLPDASRITLNSGSSISYNRLYGYTNRRTELNGEAFFEVESDADLPFEVATYNASVTVLGTKFNLRSWASEPESETEVTLTEGKLSFRAGANPGSAVILNPGERSTVRDRRATPTDPDRASVSNTLSWMENRFAFEDRPLRQIVRELERRYDLSIRVQRPQALSDSLTIYYSRSVEAEEIIRDICLSMGLQYRALNDGYVIE